jgi:hypothetical protein
MYALTQWFGQGTHSVTRHRSQEASKGTSKCMDFFARDSSSYSMRSELLTQECRSLIVEVLEAVRLCHGTHGANMNSTNWMLQGAHVYRYIVLPLNNSPRK